MGNLIDKNSLSTTQEQQVEEVEIEPLLILKKHISAYLKFETFNVDTKIYEMDRKWSV